MNSHQWMIIYKQWVTKSKIKNKKNYFNKNSNLERVVSVERIQLIQNKLLMRV